MNMLGGLSTINVELTQRCNKACWMCGRRKIERDYPELVKTYGDMPIEMVKSIADQLPCGVVVQLHNNGEPLLYPRLGDALRYFEGKIRCLDTNGKLLWEKRDEIVGNMETITVSVIENDPEAEEQLSIIKRFAEYKKAKSPLLVLRLLGNVSDYQFEGIRAIKVRRVLHSPIGSFNYAKTPVIPEIGVCLEMLHHPAIRANGDFSICVRFDPHGDGVIGNVNDHSIAQIWNSEKRNIWLIYHLHGNRGLHPLCAKCQFWGVPRG